jgi:hypothetical protein
MFVAGDRARRIGATALVLGAFAATLRAQATEQWYVEPGVGTATQRFGLAMAVQGDVMVVGAPYEDTKATDAGAVDVYRWDSSAGAWSLEQQLFASDAEASARFGSAVAVDGDVVVAGAPYKDTSKGADGGQIYVFRYSSSSGTWSQEQKLLPSVGAASDYFGTSVAVSGDVLVSGAPRNDTSSADAGCAFVFRYKNSTIKWVEEAQLLDPDAAASDYAGQSVALEGSTAAVSSYLSDESSTYDAGSVGIWTVSGSTWSQAQEIVLASPQSYGNLGKSLRLDGDLLVVCAPSEDESTTVVDSGAVYLFRSSSGSFSQEARFTAPTPASYTYFGTDADVRGKLVVVGFQSNDVSSKADCGSAFLFRRGKKSGWVLDQQLGASDFNTFDRFGAQVGLNDEQILVAAEGNDTAAGGDWGVVYGFDADEITMTITPSQPAAGQEITFSAFRGDPGDDVLITIEDVSGTPLFIPFVLYLFAADHTFTFTADAPNPLYGVSVGMRAYKISPTGPIVFSELAYVDV